MKIKLKFKKTKSQANFFDDDLTKLLHFSGGFGSGKSFCLIMKLFKLSYLNMHLPGGLVVPSYADFKKDIKPLVEEIADMNRLNINYHGSEHYYRLPWTRGKLYVHTAEKKIRGPNWAYAGINELTLIPMVRYKEVMGRVRVRAAKYPQIVSNGTPEGIQSEYYDVFVEKPLPRSRIVYSDTRENIENLDPDYIKTLEDSYDPTMLDAFMKGLWVNMSGNRFYYSYDPHRNDNKHIKQLDNYMVHVAMDFNVDPMTCSLWHHTVSGLKGFGEIVIEGGADTFKICDALIARGITGDSCYIYPDPAGNARKTSGKSDVLILQEKGFTNIRMRKKATLVRKRQLGTNNLLARGLIQLNPETMPKTKKDLIAVELDPIKLEKEKKKNPKLTHLSDGLDNMCDILYPLSGNKPSRSRVEKMR